MLAQTMCGCMAFAAKDLDIVAIVNSAVFALKNVMSFKGDYWLQAFE